MLCSWQNIFVLYNPKSEKTVFLKLSWLLIADNMNPRNSMYPLNFILFVKTKSVSEFQACNTENSTKWDVDN